MKIHCHAGLGGRVTAVVNALCHSSEVEFVWRINRHLPADHQEVFPHGIPGVQFIRSAPDWTTRFHDGGTCDIFRPFAAAGMLYRRVIASLAGSSPQNRCRLAICARYFRQPSNPSTDDLVAAAADAAKALSCDKVFLLADSHRQVISAGLASYGIRTMLPRCKELTHDLDRSQLDALQFCADWKQFLAADTIISNSKVSGLLHPAMATGKTIVTI